MAGIHVLGGDFNTAASLIMHARVLTRAGEREHRRVVRGVRHARAGRRLYGVHDLYWRIQKTHVDVYRLVPISTDDPRVRKPLVSNIPVPDPEQPPGVCASCL